MLKDDRQPFSGETKKRTGRPAKRLSSLATAARRRDSAEEVEKEEGQGPGHSEAKKGTEQDAVAGARLILPPWIRKSGTVLAAKQSYMYL